MLHGESHEGAPHLNARGSRLTRFPWWVNTPWLSRRNSGTVTVMKSSSKDKVAGNAKIASGFVKAAVGKAVGNDRLAVKGKAEKLEGKIQKKVGEAKKIVKK